MNRPNQISTKHFISKFQESLWFDYCNNPKSHSYNIFSIIDVDKSRPIHEIIFAANNLISRHALLRSTFHDKDDDGKPTKCYRREYPADHVNNVVHLMMIPVDDRDNLVKKPFELEKLYPIRFYLFVDPIKSYYKIYIICHHIVIDCLGNYNLLLDFHNLLSGKSLPMLNGTTFDDFITQYEEWLYSNDYKLKQKFWRDQINSTKNIEWPMQFSSVHQTLEYKQSTLQYQVFHNNVEELRALGHKFKVTWFVAMFSAVWITLSSFVNLKNANIWLPFSARSMPINSDKNALSQLVGHFANNMPVHLNIDKFNSIGLRSTIQQIAKLISTAKQNEMYPFIDLARYAQQTLKRKLVQQIIITKTPKMPMNSHAKSFRSDVELWFDFSEQSDNTIIFNINYNSTIFNTHNIKLMGEQFLKVVNIMKNYDDLELKIPKLLNGQDNSTSIKLISKFENDLSVPQSFPTIHELFQQQAKKSPNHLALYMGELGLSMTYEQLDKKSNQIARYLFQIGVKVETLVALHLNQDMYMIPWILGILKAGGAYIPIDKTYPAERKNYIIKDSEVSYFITDEECNDWVENFSGKTIQSDTMDVIKQSDDIIESVCHGENLCYIMYTSVLWQDVLALDEKPDVNTNFFDLGGHSLLLLQLQKKIQQQISSVDLVDLFQNPTIKSIASLLLPKDQSLDIDNSITTLNNDQVISSSEIAIIGMVGCFPGADSVDELWKMIKTGQHGIHTFTDKELDEINAKNRNDPYYVPKCGVLSNIDKFDAEFFKISQQEAVSMDPQQRLLLEKSVQALDEAGINPQYEKERIGVFVAIENSTYKNYSCNNENDPAKEYSNDINTPSGSAATRIAYHLNLKGPAFSLNSACSSSLTALKTAWNSIRCGDCDVAIVGAASIRLPQSGYVAQPGLIFSANGICRPFDHNSDGTILGNSVSVVVLKRLSDAISDQNPISAVIKSIELNNDGNNKIGYTAPSVDGQYEVIKKAIQSANLLPADINFIEAHGTATKLGDPIEIKALTKVFTELSSTSNKQCAISSVKSNIGHCNVAAGFAGLIKTVKALEDRVIPPMAKDHFEKANPLINFSSGPFYIASELQEFNKTETMHAAVSSFGIGGTNGHCILAEYKKENFDFKDKMIENTENIRVILPFSAKSINSLNNIKKEFKNYFKGYDLTTCNLYNLCNIAKTLQISRAQYEFRSMITATSISDAINQLEQIKSTIHVTSPKENIIFVVPGQGSHSISIHRQIYKSSMLYQKKFKECANILQQYDSTVPDLTSYLEKDIYDITYDPLLIFISSYISAEILKSVFNVQISGIVGHSLGQYVAATLAGVFSLEIALGIVLKRTQIMHKMDKGSMLATNLNSKLADKFIKTEKISLAALNEQRQCIFSGRSKDIEELAIILEIQDYKVKILNGVYGFHSHLTDSILDEFEIAISLLLDKAFQQSTSAIIPFISNATGEWANVEDVYTTKFWREHLRKTVQFESGIKTINSTFTNPIFVNVGIGTVTSKFIQRILNNDITIINSLDFDKTSFEEIIGNCWNNGIEINWHNYYKYICPLMTKSRLVQLPGYSFNHNCSFWVQQVYQKPLALVETITDSFVSNKIDQQPLIKYNNSSTIEGRVILCFKNTLGLKNIDINSNFFDCGGNSLLAISLISLLNKEFNIGLLSPKILFKSPTPLDLTNHIKNILSTNISPIINNGFNKSTSITKLNHGSETFKPIYMIHPVGGSCVFYKNIINSLGNVTVYGFEYPGLQDSTTIEYHSIQDLSDIYLKDLLRNNPSGPYNLFGSSFGGIVAYEMGCKLIKQGKSVNLIMVDTPTGQDIPKSMTNVAEILHYIYSKTYNLDELIGIDDDEKALQIVVEKASTLNINHNQVILPESSVITSMMLKRYVDVFNFNMKAMRTYQLPRSERPMPIIYFKAKIRRKGLDPEFPEKSWIKIQEINGGKLDCIELDGDHISVNLHPICKNITDYIKQYLKYKRS
ncbi:hypothetical protein C2G38_2028462 [Gigaspora rosea]|uniref:Carrier domain-containing protein n=1 Tax=Gigaspora rosea TaxID=44941 RepID=A0A397W3G6_9GLOM|nr:hypothetical protein C2G38_2028462 [Gigaspora rosea]